MAHPAACSPWSEVEADGGFATSATGRAFQAVDPDIAASAPAEDDGPLTDRAPEVLRAARTGASIAQIAAEVHLTPGTVRNHLPAAVSKLGGASGAKLSRRPVGLSPACAVGT
ncbi:LuxR C-terminal-related transcriptional regulator [Streptomyces sp. bgisy034]|uniref:response regulator transcription factor n=1 Tax=Streptomyces sp. bgisy034 TaxID=3413774 RepID=UPI003EBE0F65